MYLEGLFRDMFNEMHLLFTTNSAIHKAAGLTVPGRSMICLVLFHHSTVPTMKLSIGEQPLGVVPAASIFGNDR